MADEIKYPQNFTATIGWSWNHDNSVPEEVKSPHKQNTINTYFVDK